MEDYLSNPTPETGEQTGNQNTYQPEAVQQPAEPAPAWAQELKENTSFTWKPETADVIEKEISADAVPAEETDDKAEGEQRPRRRRSVLPLLNLLVSVGLVALAIPVIMNLNSKIKDMDAKYASQMQSYAQQIEELKKQGTASVKPQGVVNVPSPGGAIPSGSADLLTPAQVYELCANSTVAINCTGVSYSFGQSVPTGSSGSGFILSEDGYVVTNYHVVEGSQSIEIVLNDGTTYEAEYIGGNEANDIALIKVEAEGLPAVTVGDSTQLVVGDQVVAIGNPLGELASTLTVGYISAKDRIVTSEGAQINMLQTDAAINPGNSGGPLFNMYGQVIGITSAKYSGTTNSGATIEGIGFAIPMDDVMSMFNDLREYGYITGGYLGITVSEVEAEAAELYGLPQGVLVREVMEDSCAEAAGMRARDIIVKLGDFEIENLNDLSRALNKHKGGEQVDVTVYRSGSEKVLSVVLDERPQETEPEPEPTQPATEDYYTPWPGEDWFGGFFG